MPRLNLDIFSHDNTDNTDTVASTPKTRRSVTKRGEPTEGAAPLPRKHALPTPRFVPVGFYERHLRLLDEAVLRLRKQGHWGASKSGIIRSLIERHADELAECWLKKKAPRPGGAKGQWTQKQ